MVIPTLERGEPDNARSDQAVLTARDRCGALDQSRARLLCPKITSVCHTQTRRLRPVEGIQGVPIPAFTNLTPGCPLARAFFFAAFAGHSRRHTITSLWQTPARRCWAVEAILAAWGSACVNPLRHMPLGQRW